MIIEPNILKEADKIIINPETGYGKNNKLDGLYDHEIDHIMSNTKYYLRTITIDEIDEIINKIIKYNILKCCFIMNLSKRDDKKGYKHWVAIYINLINDMSIEYYDSYADPIPKILIDKFNKMLEDMNINVYVKLKENKIKDQPLNSSLCGYYSIAFLLKRLNNIPFSEATNYKSLNETNMKELKKKYEKFKFI